MVNISNQALATLLVVAIVISLGGTLISLNRLGGLMPLTGRATSSTASVTITGAAGIDVTNNIDLGTGTANSSGGILNISSNFSTNSGFGFNSCHAAVSDEIVCGGLQVQNTGNVDINVTFNISENASTFLGGTSSSLTWTGTPGNASYVSNGCGTPTQNITVIWNATRYGQWLTPLANLTTPGQLSNQTLCSNLTWETGQDFVTWQINLTVPSDVTTGLHTTTIQFTSSQIS